MGVDDLFSRLGVSVIDAVRTWVTGLVTRDQAELATDGGRVDCAEDGSAGNEGAGK